MTRSAEILNVLLDSTLSKAELATRMGVPRETVSRWARGVHAPTLEALQRAAAAAGYRLVVDLEPADAELVELVRDQLDLAPADRLCGLLEERWPACRDALRLAAELGDLAVVAGPVAAALWGAPHRLTGRVDAIVNDRRWSDVDDVLFGRGAEPAGVRAAGPSSLDERRSLWAFGAGTLTIRSRARDVRDVDAVLRRAVAFAIADVGVVRVPRLEDLLALSQASAWSEEHIYVPSLRAVLASGRYRAGHELHAAL